MTDADAEVEALAKQLYDALQTPKPSWEQLGDVTKSVWRERAMSELMEGLA